MTRDPTPLPPNQAAPKPWRLRNILARLFVLVLAFAITTLAAGWIFRTEIATTALLAALRYSGIPNASLTVTKLTWGRATLTRVVFPPTVRAKSLDLRYSLAGVLSQRLDQLHVTGFHFDGAASKAPDNDGFRIPKITIPVDRIRVTDATAVFKNGGGEAVLQIAGVITTTPRQTIDVKATIKGAVTTSEMKASFTGDLEALHLSSSYSLAHLTISQVTLKAAAREVTLSSLSAQIIHSPKTGVEIDMSGKLRGADIPPETKFALALKAPKLQTPTPLDFHAIFDSALGWSEFKGRLNPDGRATAAISGAYEPNGETAAHFTGDMTGQLGEDAAFSLTAAISPNWALPLMHPNSSAAGAIALTINGAIPLNDTSADPLALAHAARLNGNVEFDLSNPTLPDLFDAKAVSGALKFTAHDDAVDITFLHDIAVQGLEIAPRLAPPQLRRRLSGFLTLSTPPSAPLRLRNTFDKPTLDLPNDMIATTPDDRIALPKGATFRFNPRLSFIDADIPRLTFQTDKLGVTGFPSRVSGTLENVRLTPLQALGKYRLSAAGTLAQPPLSGQLRAAISGSFKQRGPTFILTADVNSVLNVSDLDIAETVQSAAPLTLSPAKTVTLSIDTSKPVPSLTYSALLDPINAQLKGNFPPVTLAFPDIEISGSATGHTIRLGGGNLQIPAYALSLKGVALQAALGPKKSAALSVATIDHLDDTPFVVPLQLQATGALQNDQAAFDGRFTSAGGNIDIRADGAHNFTENSGKIAISTKKITFLPSVLQPGALFPPLRHMFREVDGDIALNTTWSWRDGNLQSSAEALVNLTRLKTDEVTVKNAAVILHFNNLFPPTTPPGQSIDIGEIDIGVPLTDGRVLLHLRADGSVLAGLEKFNLFGGRIETTPFVLPKSFDNFTIPLAVTGIRLAELLAVAKSGDLTATGALDGSIPLTISGGEIAVRGGLLTSVAGGLLQYKPRAIGPALSDANAGAAMFLDLVKDFTYDEIQVTLDEGEFEQIAFGFKIKGRNKTVYNGLPVDLNVTLTGPLRDILQQGHETFTTPAWLRDRIAEFEQNSSNREGAR